MRMIEVEYNKPIEVSKSKFLLCKNLFGGILAFREEKGRFFIMLWMPNAKKTVESVINK